MDCGAGGGAVDATDGRLLRLDWLERFKVVSKRGLRKHGHETLETAEYEHLGVADAYQVIATMEWIVDAFTRCLKEERSFNVDELVRLRRLGTQRAQQGIPLDGLKDNFRTGVAQCFAEFTEIAFRASGLQAGQMLTTMILQELMPLAAKAEDAFTAGYNECSGRSRPDNPSELAQLCLSRQELRVLRLLPGLTNREIAARLRCSPETVKTHVARILCKLGAQDRAHAVAIGMWWGIIPDRLAAANSEVPA